MRLICCGVDALSFGGVLYVAVAPLPIHCGSFMRSGFTIIGSQSHGHSHNATDVLLQVVHLSVDCRALQPEQGSFAQLLALFRGSPILRRLDISCCEAVDVSAAIPMLPSLVNLEVLSIEELDGLRNHGETLQVCPLHLPALACCCPSSKLDNTVSHRYYLPTSRLYCWVC